MASKQVDSYEDQKYQQKKSLYDSIVQAFTDFKDENYSHHKWNVHTQDLKGITIKLLNNEHISLTYHRIEIGTTDTLAKDKDKGAAFLKEVEKGIKKHFKKNTKKALKLKKIREDQVIDKYSTLYADTSWIIGTRLHRDPTGKYLVRDTRIYTFDEDLLGDND